MFYEEIRVSNDTCDQNDLNELMTKSLNSFAFFLIKLWKEKKTFHWFIYFVLIRFLVLLFTAF